MSQDPAPLDAGATRWTHVDDDLPKMNTVVLVVGFNTEGKCWRRIAWRVPMGGGSWIWESHVDDFDNRAKQLEYWMLMEELPATRRVANPSI